MNLKSESLIQGTEPSKNYNYLHFKGTVSPKHYLTQNSTILGLTFFSSEVPPHEPFFNCFFYFLVFFFVGGGWCLGYMTSGKKSHFYISRRNMYCFCDTSLKDRLEGHFFPYQVFLIVVTIIYFSSMRGGTACLPHV